MIPKWLIVLSLALCAGGCSSDPDTQPDAGETDLGDAADASLSGDVDASGDDTGTFDCYGQACQIGAEYCPGSFCSGAPADDNGECPAGCQMCLSGAGFELCQCDLPTCTALPDGCSDCSCVDPPATGCMCVEAADGAIQVECLSA